MILPEGYRGQKYQVEFLSPHDRRWYVWGWQDNPTGGLVTIVEDSGTQCRVSEVSSMVRAIFKITHKAN